MRPLENLNKEHDDKLKCCGCPSNKELIYCGCDCHKEHDIIACNVKNCPECDKLLKEEIDE